MAHNVLFSVPVRELGKADVEFYVSNGGAKIGTLKVSKGLIEWVPKDFTLGYQVSWKDFDIFMRKNGIKKT